LKYLLIISTLFILVSCGKKTQLKVTAKNATIQELTFQKPTTIRDVYVSTVAEDVVNIKRRIAIELNRHGIQTVLTKPEDLNIDTLNKYLELKSKGMI
jgi:hypothetical protein